MEQSGQKQINVQFVKPPLGGDRVHLKHLDALLYSSSVSCTCDSSEFPSFTRLLKSVACLLCGNQIPLCMHKQNILLMLH